MDKKIQIYDPKQEFAIERVYQKLTRGIDDLTAGEAVDGLLHGATVLRQTIDKVVERIFQGAEGKQAAVVQEKTEDWRRHTEKVGAAIGEAAKSGDYATVEARLAEATKATIVAKESVSKMKYIKMRGQSEYNASKDLTAYVRELEGFVKSSYNGNKMLTGELVSRGDL